MIYELLVADLLYLTQTVRSSIHVLSVTSRLNLQQTARSNIIPLSVTNSLYFIPRVTVRSTIQSHSVISNLNLTQSVTKGPPLQTVFQNVQLYQIVQINPGGVIQSTLNLSQTIDVYKGYGLTNNLNLVQIIGLDIVKELTITSNLNLTNTVSAFVPNANFIPDPVTPGIHVLSIRYGNIEKIEQNKIIRRSRGDDLIVYRDSMWPQWDTLLLTIMNLNDDQRQQLLYLLNLSLGQIVEIYDHENVGYHVFCTSPSAKS